LRLEVGRPEPAPQLERRSGQLGPVVELSRTMRQLRLPQEEATMLDAFGVVLQGRACSPQPAAGDRRSRADGVVLPQPHRALAGSAVVAELVVQPVRRLSGGDA